MSLLVDAVVTASYWAYTTTPNHPGDMPKGTLHAILKQASVSVEDFLVAR